MEIIKSATVKFPKFATRLSSACDRHADCPPLHKGRQVWLKNRLAQEGLFVSVEGIRKWLAGETRPKEENAEKLARVLAVDPHWLRIGSMLASPSSQEDETMPPIAATAPPLQVGIRPSLAVEIRGLPLNLTKVEAAKLGAVLLALATVD